jgi:hypothetical protein
LGLLCIVDHSRETKDAVEIVCLELSKGNVGRGKKIDWIAGCLIAFAVEKSVAFGHRGAVFLKPKTRLIRHYMEKYGFYHFLFEHPSNRKVL